MIKSFREIDNRLINEVCKCFEETYDFNFLKEKYRFLDYNVLYSILYSTGKYNQYIHEYICQTSINDKKILIISDTHYGSVYENMNYAYDVFDFATANGIHSILHGGDIIEANVTSQKGFNSVKQANHFIRVYPSDKNITTYAVFGNHDYLAIDKKEEIRDILVSRDDINMLGFKKVYLKWCGQTISLHHEIENFKLNLPLVAECLSFRGHSHFFHTKEMKNRQCERIYMPAMCIEPVFYISNPNIKNKIVLPGFLTAEIEDDSIIIAHYSFDYGNIVKENEFVKVLKK